MSYREVLDRLVQSWRSSATRAARATATEAQRAVCSWASAMLAAKPVVAGASFVIQIR